MTPARQLTLALLLGLVACEGSDPTEDSGADSGSDTNTGAACETLAPTSCSDRADCATINGRAPTEADCIDYTEDPVAYGCMSADGGCDAAITWARPDDQSDCIHFTSGCLPNNWQRCETPDTPECPTN